MKERTNERTRKSKKCTVMPSSQRPRMSEDEGIHVDASASTDTNVLAELEEIEI